MRRLAPGRPRNRGYDTRILGEVVRELGASGFRDCSIQRVADAAGVARATVSLRWPDREELIMAALMTTRGAITRPDSGTLCGDLAHTVHEWAEVFRSEELTRLIGRIEVKQNDDPEFFERYQSRIARPAGQVVADIVKSAQLRGEARVDADPVAAARCLVGALYLQSISGAATITPGFEREIVRTVGRSLLVRPGDAAS